MYMYTMYDMDVCMCVCVYFDNWVFDEMCFVLMPFQHMKVMILKATCDRLNDLF